MQESAPITFHVGLHKTGSSYLQHCVFPRMADISYVKHQRRRRSLAETIALARAGGPSLVSQEGLSGEPSRDDYPEHREACLRFLAESYPGSRIIIFLREPSEWLASVYRQCLLGGETRPFRAFAGRYIDNGSLDCRHLLDKLKALPFSDVLALRHEDLRDRPEETIAALCAFVGCEELCMSAEDWIARRKVGTRNAAARTLRLLNHVCTLRAPLSSRPFGDGVKHTSTSVATDVKTYA